MTDDLLALLVEVSSVTASGRQLKKPIEVPRPKPPKPQRDPGMSDTDFAFKKAVGVLAASSKAVKR